MKVFAEDVEEAISDMADECGEPTTIEWADNEYTAFVVEQESTETLGMPGYKADARISVVISGNLFFESVPAEKQQIKWDDKYWIIDNMRRSPGKAVYILDCRSARRDET